MTKGSSRASFLNEKLLLKQFCEIFLETAVFLQENSTKN